MTILSRFVSMTLSFIVSDPTMKFICSDVQSGFFAFRSIFMKFSYCLDVIFFFEVVRENVRCSFEFHEETFFLLLWCVVPSGRTLKKSSLTLVCLVFRGSSVVLHVSESGGVRVL
jgi:hypothetical protein